MADFKLLNFAGTSGEARPGILVGDDRIVDLEKATGGASWATSTLAVLNDWDTACAELQKLADSPAETLSLSDVTLLAPILYPPAIYCAGANYRKHAMEMSPDGKTFPDKTRVKPYFFLKNGPHCVIGPGDDIRLPAISDMIDWEAEFAVVIGRRGKNIALEDAMDYIAGYTIMNDLSARDQGKRDDWPRFASDWFSHKNFDGAAPLGPWITPAAQIADPYACRMKLWVNDDEMQNELVEDLIFDIADQIQSISERLTLYPGDVISTGTPSGVGRPRGIFLKPGDTVRIVIDGIGELRNPVVQGD